jgi:aminopeptidase
MKDLRCEKLAELITGHSLAVKPGQKIVIRGPVDARPLILALEGQIWSRGGFPLTQLAFPESEELAYRHASDAMLAWTNELDVMAVERFDGLVLIQGEENPRANDRVAPERRRLALSAAMAARNLVMKRAAAGNFAWLAVHWPTAGWAQAAGMSTLDYQDLVFAACLPDLDDPVAYWNAVEERQRGYIKSLDGARLIRIEADETDLSMSVAGRRFDNGCSRHNLPDGEIYTGPVEDSAEGRIRFPGRVIYRGAEIRDMRFRFEQGLVVEATAASGQEHLLALLDSDAGARRLGEVALGLNAGIKELSGQILVDEKAGGTMHIALGNGYPQTGSINRSALHLDLVLDTRKGGRVTVDGRTVLENGILAL